MATGGMAETNVAHRPVRMMTSRHGLPATSTEEHSMLKMKVVAWALGSFGAITFSVCVLYGLIVPESLHMKSVLEQMLPAFKWLTWWGFLLGLVESFLYGAYAGLVFVPLYNWFSARSSPRGS